MSSVGTPTSQVIIYVKKSGSDITGIYDVDRQCMKAAISSFEILSDLKISQDGLSSLPQSPQIVLHLKEFSEKVHYYSEAGEELLGEHNREIDALYCATKSVLQYLHAHDCVGKDTILFQAIRGSHETRDLSVSRLFVIALGQNEECSLLNYKEGIISRTYAYLDERQVCMFLNDASQETVQKLDTVLGELFQNVTSLPKP